ncbi:hypothetical protein EMPS_10900 [Entomortierella parvispora]|nr:hypothetical protein EMPS_08694 [Entomortierella parvispora]GJJ78541.1 hypothetical protein EMPS_10900 [Entomortierella parvispora]
MVANRLLELVGGSLGAKQEDGNKVIIGIGLGQFSSSMRLTTLHSSFETYFVQQARSLGYIVVGVNEYYTSQRCPVCTEFVGQVDLRRLYCSKCKAFMHRDVMAGHNMCNVIQEHLLNQRRPRYLQPRDANNNYPWEDPNYRRRGPTSKIQIPSDVKQGVKRKAPVDDSGMEELTKKRVEE